MKKFLSNIVRKNSQEDKSLHKVILTQNERNSELPDNFFKKFLNSISQKDIFFYPNTKKLINKIAKHYNIKPYNILLTPGSDIGIKTIFETFDLKGKNIITTNYFFGMYEVYSKLYETKLKKAVYSKNKFNVRKILNKIDKDTQFIILANPNSPVGDTYTTHELKTLLDTGVHLVIDEAYIELSSAESFISKINEYKNLTILRTFSKGYGAAGCRVGFIVSNKENIDYYSKFRFMYEISGMSMKYIEFILDNHLYFQRYFEKTLKSKNKFVNKLKNTKLYVIDSDSSWFFIKSSKLVKDMFSKNRISIRETDHPYEKGKWIKFNYDLKVEKTNILNDLLTI